MNRPPRSPRYDLILPALLILLAGWRLLTAWHAGLELYADEAQYWSWSLTPDWGYYSKPPMVAWLIHLGDLLFGDSELGLRAATFLLWPGTAYVLFLLVRRLYAGEPWGERAAFWSALTFASLPMVSLGSWLITTDGPLLLFWSLSLYFLAGALEHGRWRDWLLTGVTAGLGLMSKYSMVFFVPALLVYLAVTPVHRHWLKSAKPWAGAMVAFFLLLPNLLWNAGHHFVSVHHTADISQLDRQLLHPGAMLEFFGGQFGVFGPVTALGLLLLLLRPASWFSDPRSRFLAAFCLIPLGLFLGLSLLSRAFANWAAFSYVAGAGLVVVTWIRFGRSRWLAAALALNFSIGAVMYHYHDLAEGLGVPLTRKTDPYTRITGYRELGLQVRGLLQQHPGSRLLGDDRKVFASLLYYTRPLSAGAAFLNPSGRLDNHYAMSSDIQDTPQGEFIFITRRDDETAMQAWFTEVDSLGTLQIPIHTDYRLEFNAWRVRDFRGYGPGKRVAE